MAAKVFHDQNLLWSSLYILFAFNSLPPGVDPQTSNASEDYNDDDNNIDNCGDNDEDVAA